MDFDPNKALAYARALSRPRLVGSSEDERVAGEVAAQLESLGYQVEREPFQFTRAFDLALAYEIGLALVLIAVSWFLPSFRIVAALVIMVLLIGVTLLNNWIQRQAVAPDPNPAQPASPFLGWGRLYRTANILARPERDDSNLADKPHVYLMAHFDSKSQRMPITLRVALIMAFVISLFLFVIMTLAAVDLGPAPVIMSVIAFLAGAPLLLLDVGNESPGAIDNASGMGLVLHLAEVLQSRPDLLDNARFTMLITSAEEMATMGALYHVRRHLAELHRDGQRLTVINFDGVGVEGQLHWSGRLGLGIRFGTAARALGIWIRPFRWLGVLFDHIPFLPYGFSAATLLTIGPATWGVHTARDTPDKLSARGFEQAGQVALRVIEQIVLG